MYYGLSNRNFKIYIKSPKRTNTVALSSAFNFGKIEIHSANIAEGSKGGMKNVCLYYHSLKPIGKIECIEDRHSNIEYIRVYGKYENADILPILRCTQPCFTDE